MINPQILSLGTANPPSRFTQQQCFEATGYKGERIRKIFLNSDIEFRHFYFEGSPNLDEDSDQRNQRLCAVCSRKSCFLSLPRARAVGKLANVATALESALVRLCNIITFVYTNKMR